MKNRILTYVLIGLLAITAGMIWSILSMKDQESTRVFDATVNRDCAPWDGPAFTVSVPYDVGSVIEISVWRSPGIRFPTTLTFPDQTGKIGNALYKPHFGTSGQLNGIVSFTQFEEGSPVTGEFNLRTDNGNQDHGKFRAIWENKIAICG